MKVRSSRFVAVLAMLCSATMVAAAQRGDTDGDGKLTVTEFQAMMKKRLMRADTDHDGKISLEEWKARPAAAKAKGDPVKAFQRLDANGDQSIDAAEIAPLLKQRFDRIDTNADGALSEQELSARRAATAGD
jgi:Ca2+-binding EF-hand superfamily protein